MLGTAQGQLRVQRVGPRVGMLWWRRADYAVFRVMPDGSQEEVLSGRFRSGAAALLAARNVMA